MRATGYFDSKAQLLDLRKDIYLQTSTGNEAWMSQAYVDINKGNGDVGRACRRQIAERHVRGHRLRIINSGEVVRFEGDVVMNLDNAELPDEATAARAADGRRAEAARSAKAQAGSANTK